MAGPVINEGILLTVNEVARLLNVSPRHVHMLRATQQLPPPVRLGRSVRWRRAELEAWVAAGCPALDRWRPKMAVGG